MPNAKVVGSKPMELKARTCERKRMETKKRKDTVPRETQATTCPRRTRPCNSEKTRAGGSGTQKDTRSNPIINKVSPKRHGTRVDLREECAAEIQDRPLLKSQSNKAFTVFAPNPKRRHEIQRKAAAELAALEDLRLSQAMAFVSITPSTVGGCLTLEEVRNRQQQEMKMRKIPKQSKRYLTSLQ
ncbi:hypothetical protein GN956_G14844 [Arapaima gigas]